MVEVSGIDWPAMTMYVLCMAHVIQLALGASMSSRSVKSCTKSWEAHERDQQFGDDESTDIGKSQRLPKEGNARFNKVLAMRPGLAKIVQKVGISRHLGRPETYHHIADIPCCIDYSDTLSSKRHHWLSNSQSTNHSTTYDGYENMMGFDTRGAWACLLIMRSHPKLAQESEILWFPPTHHNTGWMDHRQVSYGSLEAIPILDPVDVEKSYGYSGSCHHCLQWHGWSYASRYASSSVAEESMEGWLTLRCEVCMTDAVKISCWSHSNQRYGSRFSPYLWFFPEVVII